MVADRNVLPIRTRFHWRLAKRNKQEISICTRVAFYSVAALAYAGVALAGPTGGEVVGGSGTITQSGPTTDIHQASQRLDIDWQTFSTGVNESVNFYQPGSSAIAINRVVGGVPSELRGALTANGRVFILNESGITFYSTSRVNVGALLATTAANLAIDGDSFSFSGDGYGQVVNQGNITVSDGGFAILAAPYVANTGVIEANLGQIRLTSTNAYTLDLRGDGLITFTVDSDTLGEIAEEGEKLGVDNTGVLRARSGQVAITAETASKIVASVVNLDGVVDADAFAAGMDGGTVLVASTGDLNITGEVRADGGVDGNGGQIVTKADGTNTVAATATLSARGGDQAGDGGFIEVSGKHFKLAGTIDATAPNGDGGNFLLDPADLRITDGSGTGGTDTVSEASIEARSHSGMSSTYSASNSIVVEDIADNAITGGDGDIRLITTGAEGGVGTITFNDLNDSIVTRRGDITIKAAGSNPDITIGNLRTGAPLSTATSGVADPGFIVVMASGSAGDIVNVGDITVTAKGGSGALAGALLAAGGDITVNGDTLVTASGDDLALAGVGMVAGASGDLAFNGDLTVTADATARETNASAFAGAFLQAGGDVTVVTPSSTMRIEANATNTVENGEGALAGAALVVRAGNDGLPSATSIAAIPSSALLDPLSLLPDSQTAGGGDIAITGNTVVAANATVTVGTKDIGSDTSGFAGAIAGDASALAGAFYSAHSGSSTEAAAAGNVTVTGNTTVDANADIAVGDLSVHDISLSNSDFTAFSGQVAGDALASAGFQVDADGGVTINSDVTVTADAHITVGNIAITNIFVFASYDEFASFTGFDSTVVGSASANALFDVDAGGPVSIGAGGGGTVTAAADATIDVGNITVSGTASASSDSDSSATAELIGFYDQVADRAYADASIDISSAAGSVTVGDAIVVDANASISVGDVSVDGRAYAEDSSGSSWYDGASALFTGFDSALADGATANATLTITHNEGDVSLTGGVTVDADAALSVGDIAINGTASAKAKSSGTARANFYGFDDDVFDDSAIADASASVDSNAGAVTVAGGLSVDANAASNVGNIAITGIADARVSGSDSYTSAEASFYSAEASFYGVYGDVFQGSADADAHASLSRNQGVSVSGGIAVAAMTDITAGNVDITGSAKAITSGNGYSAEANASFTGIDDDILESGRAYATLDIDSNDGDVTLDGISAAADTDITVGAITIRGGRTVSTEGSSFFQPGGAIARADGYSSSVRAYADFSGIADDVIDSGYADADVSIDGTQGNVTINGDVAVKGSTDIAIGTINFDASARATAAGYNVRANASTLGVENAIVDGDASGSASFAVRNTTGSEGSGGNVTITGDIDVTGMGVAIVAGLDADARVTARSIASGDAWAEASFVGNNVFGSEAEGSGRVNFSNDQGNLTVGGDVTVTGIARLEAESVTVAANVLAEASGYGGAFASFTAFEEAFFDSSATGSAQLNLSNIGGDATLGGVTLTADGTLAIGNVTVTGTALASTTLAADPTASLTVFGSEVFYYSASGSAEFSAYRVDGNLTVNGPVDVAATGAMTIGDVAIDLNATANAPSGGTAYASATAFGSEVTSSEGVADAEVRVYSVGGDVAFGGGITVTADMLMTIGDVTFDGSANANAGRGGYADANVTAFDDTVFDDFEATDNSASVSISNVGGDVTISGGVTIDAAVTAAFGDIAIKGVANAIADSGRANADVTGFYDELYSIDDSEGSVDGRFSIYNVGTSEGGGDVAINGDISVAGTFTFGIGDVTISGSANAKGTEVGGSANAYVTAFEDEIYESADEISADAYVYIHDVNGDVTVNGDIAVRGALNVTMGDIAINGVARATGSTSGDAFASFTAFDDDLASDFSDLSADAYLNIGSVDGDVTLNGDIAVDGALTYTVGDIAVQGSAFGLAINSNTHGTRGVASFTAFYGDIVNPDYASAYASIEISEVGGDVTVNGQTDVAANGVVGVGNVSVDGTASASANTEGFAQATVRGFDGDIIGSGVDASASIDIWGVGGAVAFNGPVMVDADATVTVGNVNLAGKAMTAGTGDTARASFNALDSGIADGDADAEASFEVGAGTDFSNTGGISVDANGTVHVGNITVDGTASTGGGNGFEAATFNAYLGDIADSASGYAYLDIWASNNVTIAGDVASRATADIVVGDIAIALSGNAAPASIVPNVPGEANADAYLGIFAGLELSSGSVDIAGNVNVDAFATVSGLGPQAGYGSAYADASGEIRAANNVLIGPKPEDFFVGNEVAARAIADTDGSYASADADLVIEAGQAFSVGSDSYGGEGGEEVFSSGNLFIKADVLSFASANAAAAELSDGGENGEQSFYFEGGVSADANLELYAHGDPPEFGNLTNEYYTHEPQAIARVNAGAEEAFVNATQADLDSTVANDPDGSPFTYDDEDFGEYTDATITVHWHGEGLIFQMPMPEEVGGEGVDPYILIKPKPEVPGLGVPITPTGALALLPGGTSCSLGVGGFTIDPDGSVIFGQYIFDINPEDLDLAACDDNVRYPIFTDQQP